jgi:hypothetical protein
MESIGLTCTKKSLCHSALPDFVGKKLYRRCLSRLKRYRFEIFAFLHHLGWIDVPHAIFKSLEKTQESIKIYINLSKSVQECPCYEGFKGFKASF